MLKLSASFFYLSLINEKICQKISKAIIILLH